MNMFDLIGMKFNDVIALLKRTGISFDYSKRTSENKFYEIYIGDSCSDYWIVIFDENDRVESLEYWDSWDF